MALDIILVKNESVPHWEDEESVHFGSIDPYEWESLFFTDFSIETYFEFAKENEDLQRYDTYYSEKIDSLQKKFPMITRIKDYYQDASFSAKEIEELTQEILLLKTIVKRQKSKNLLKQLLGACEIALKNGAGLTLVAD